MPHSRSGFSRPNRSRRQTGWEAGVGGTAVAALINDTPIFLGSGVQPQVDGLTLVRTRGLFSIELDVITAAGDGFFGAVGIGICTNAAFAAGIASVPSPIAEQGWDNWLYYQFFSVHGGVNAADDSFSSSSKIEIDSKAMRKVTADETIFAVLEATETGSAIGNVRLDTRMLFKLA